MFKFFHKTWKEIEPYFCIGSVLMGTVGGIFGYLSPLKNILGIPLSIVTGIILLLLIALLCILILNYIKKLSHKKNKSKFIELKNIPTYVVFRKLNDDIIVEESVNTYSTHATITSSNNKMGSDSLKTPEIYSIVCIFHDYIRINNIIAKDSENNHFNIRREQYTHMYAHFYMYNLEEGKSVRIDFK